MTKRQGRELTELARELRVKQTKAESLLWQVLRGRRLCGLKFRRQYPIAPYIADFACIERHQIIEVDGGYHDYVFEADSMRQAYLESKGWMVMRFSNEELLSDVEAVAVSIAKQMGLDLRLR